ncbi:hypothetical protein GA0070624_5895 [Micromonospora rhizosphaerae]|uniref:Uncharacterized protein n=1 Tax=Micromonospora rhizosphaerae TaxID=568872 RepID=A0A1C6T7L1_9ACTN|nr:hypothetical protein GA0070624_5895 [Micromonospora rhizosphaerae]
MLSRVSASARPGKKQEDSGHDRQCTRQAATRVAHYHGSGRPACPDAGRDLVTRARHGHASPGPANIPGVTDRPPAGVGDNDKHG